jgi:hypothetical protein
MNVEQVIARLSKFPLHTPVLWNDGACMLQLSISGHTISHDDTDVSGAAEDLGVGTFVVLMRDD